MIIGARTITLYPPSGSGAPPSAETSEGGGPLPSGWTEQVDPASGVPYYFHAERGETVWERPPPDPVAPTAPRGSVTAAGAAAATDATAARRGSAQQISDQAAATIAESDVVDRLVKAALGYVDPDIKAVLADLPELTHPPINECIQNITHQTTTEIVGELRIALDTNEKMSDVRELFEKIRKQRILDKSAKKAKEELVELSKELARASLASVGSGAGGVISSASADPEAGEHKADEAVNQKTAPLQHHSKFGEVSVRVVFGGDAKQNTDTDIVGSHANPCNDRSGSV